MAKIVAITEHQGPGKSIREVVKSTRGQDDLEVSLYPTALTSNLYDDYPELKEIPSERVEKLRGEHMPKESLDSFIQEIFEEEKPDLILTATIDPSPAIDKAMIREANRRNLPSVAVMDYWCRPDQYRARFPSEEFVPSIIASLDEIDRDNLMRAGLPEEIIAMTGNPNFDGLKKARRKFVGKDVAFSDFNLMSEMDLLVTYVPDPLHSDMFSFEDAYKINRDTFFCLDAGLTRVAADWDTKIDLAVMLHPKDLRAESGLAGWRDIFGHTTKDYIHSFLGRDNMEDRRLSLDDARMASSLVISGRSTSGAECLYLGAPVMILHPGLEFYKNGLNHFIEKGVIPAANSIEAGMELVSRFVYDSRFRANYMGRQEVYKNQPDSAPQVVEIMKNLL